MSSQTITRDPQLTGASALGVPSPGRTVARMTWRSVGTDLAYLTAGFFLSVVSFVLLLTLFTLGAATAVVWVGLPITGFMLLTATGFARENRELLRRWGAPVEEPTYRRRRVLTMLRDPKAWLETVHGMLVAFPLRLTTFVVSVTWLAGALGGLTWFLWGHFLPQDDDNGLAWLLGTVLDVDITGSWYLWESLTMGLAGLVLLLTAPLVTRLCVRADVTVARALLGPLGSPQAEAGR